jgi:tRNA modification GTPase
LRNPDEFSRRVKQRFGCLQRAFFNGRLDLTEAEGVAATIAANSERELDAARRLGAGELARRLQPTMDSLTQTLALVEAGIDFSEEEIRFVSAGQVRQSAAEIVGDLEELLAASGRFERLTHEPVVVLCGRPNAGKSTLLNALAGRQRAVVSPMAGTTRDLLSAQAKLRRGMVTLVDTAGLEWENSADSIARQMLERAINAIDQADVLVLVREAGEGERAVALPREPALVVMAKADLHGGDEAGLRVSAITGEGLAELRDRIDEAAFGGGGDETLALNARHTRQIQLAIEELNTIIEKRTLEDELLAEHLRAAADALGEITGIVSTEDLLGRIFSTFCIGK